MTGKELANESINTIIDDGSKFYVLFSSGIDEAVCSVDKRTKEIKNLYSLISNDYVFDLLKNNKIKKHMSEKEIEEFKQFLLSFA